MSQHLRRMADEVLSAPHRQHLGCDARGGGAEAPRRLRARTRTACTLNPRPPRAQEVPTTSTGQEGKEGKDGEGATQDAAKQKEEELRAAKVHMRAHAEARAPHRASPGPP